MEAPQSTGSKSSGQGKNGNSDWIKSELKGIGDRIESIAQELKVIDDKKGTELYRLGNQIEHFFDEMSKTN